MKTKIIISLSIFLLLGIYKAEGYNYNWKDYNIEIPENIIELENKYFNRELDINSYEFKIIKLNILLIKKGLKPLYK